MLCWMMTHLSGSDQALRQYQHILTVPGYITMSAWPISSACYKPLINGHQVKLKISLSDIIIITLVN